MKGKLATLVTALLLASMQPATAAGSVTSTIGKMMMDQNYDTKLFIKMTASISNPIGCSTHPSWDFVLDTSSEFGWQLYAVLQNALNNSSQISVLGAGDCDTFSGIETLRRIEF